MQYVDCYNFLKSRLVPVSPRENGDGTIIPVDEAVLHIQPIPCASFRELSDHYFAAEALEYSLAIKQTVAMMAATILSTRLTGGQLAIRVLGPPGSVKSTISECFSAATELVYARSKFTGLVSGWSSIRRSQNTASKINNMCLLCKDADTMLQLTNLKQVESELRDALGDGVIRAEYRTGRDFEIRTLFTMILCGTPALKDMDDALLGARFMDIRIHERGSDTSKIVRRSINSQISTLCSQLSGGIGINNNDDPKLKKIIKLLAPPTVGFLYGKAEKIRTGVDIRDDVISEDYKDRIQSMGDLVSFIRTKPKRGMDKEIRYRVEREFATRISEQLSRSAIFLAIVNQEHRPIAGPAEFEVVDKLFRDTAEGYTLDIVKYLHSAGKADRLDIAANCDINPTTAYSVLEDMVAVGTADYYTASNPHGKRGRKSNIYRLTDEVAGLCRKISL